MSPALSQEAISTGPGSGPSPSSEHASADAFRYWSPWLVALVPIWIGGALLVLDDPTGALRENWSLFFVGVFGAVVGNATAVGGGLVFLPFLMLVYDLDPVTALRLAVACQAFGMTSGAVAWWRRGRIPARAFASTLPAIVAGCLVGGLVIPVEPALVKGLFGPVSCAIGACTLFTLSRTLFSTEVRHTWDLQLCAVLGAILTGWVAIGIGEAIAAFLILRQRTCAERAIALGVVSLSAASICLFAIFAATAAMPWPQISCMALGCIFGARLAPLLALGTSQRALKLGFGVVALAHGAMFTFLYGW